MNNEKVPGWSERPSIARCLFAVGGFSKLPKSLQSAGWPSATKRATKKKKIPTWCHYSKPCLLCTKWHSLMSSLWWKNVTKFKRDPKPRFFSFVYQTKQNHYFAAHQTHRKGERLRCGWDSSLPVVQQCGLPSGSPQTIPALQSIAALSISLPLLYVYSVL